MEISICLAWIISKQKSIIYVFTWHGKYWVIAKPINGVLRKKIKLQELFTQSVRRTKNNIITELYDYQWWTNQASVEMADGFHKPPEEV